MEENRQQNLQKNLLFGGLNIVSGMAKGIDSLSHRSCIDAGGRTIAVIASGFNNIYPKENEELFYKILETGGLVISEYAPNEKANKKNFPERNRIVSGISIGVLVVEAAYRSGTSITARYAKKQGKDIYCIPSSIDSNKGVGTARLIEQGAKIVLKPENILKNYNLKNKNICYESKEFERKFPPMYVDTYKCIEMSGSYINYIAKKADKSINEITQELFMLELEGYVEKLPGGLYVPKT